MNARGKSIAVYAMGEIRLAGMCGRHPAGRRGDLPQGYGMANLEYNIPITPATIFHVASVSKQFAAAAILLLERDGMLSVSDDVRKTIPELHDFGATITIDHLIHHTSGLRDQWELLTLAGGASKT